MIKAYYIASTAMMTQQKALNAISGNVANAGTDGYKKVTVGFRDMLYSSYNDNVAGAYEIGNGVAVSSITRNHSSGTMESTGKMLDISIEGDGFFRMLGADGNTYYRKSTGFSLSDEADGAYIVDSGGNYLLDDAGAKINVGEERETISISEDGTVIAGDREYRLGIASFLNPGSLKSASFGLYSNPGNIAGESAANTSRVMQGYIEKSNVSLAEEFSNMIITQRMFEMNSKLVQVADELQGLSNRLRK